MPIVAAALVIIFVVLLVIYYLLPRERSTFVEARTSIARISLAQDMDWRLSEAGLCGRSRRSRGMAAARSSSDLCGSAPVLAPPDAVDIRWPSGTVIELTRRGIGPLGIRVVSLPGGGPIEALGLQGTIRVSQGDRAVVPAATARDLAAVPVHGFVELGDRIEGGANEILYAGRYQFRERLIGRKRSDVVAADDLMPGDSVVIFDRHTDAPMAVAGFVAAPADGESGMQVIASAARRGIWPVLRVGRHGFEATDIVPGWTDRALADQLTLALVAILGFGAAFTTIAVGIYDLIAPRD